MYTKTKQMIFDYLMEETGNLQENNLCRFTSNYICEKFIISRSLASHYLNELFKEGQLIKVNERPVLYLHSKTIQAQMLNKTLRNEYDTIDELIEIMHTGVLTFADVIGSDYSLRNSLVSIKKALHYPVHGLPFVLTGKSGSGRKFISQCVYEYCKSKSFISPNSEYYLVPCSDMDTVTLNTYLFGKEGIFNKKNVGLVVFNDIQMTTFTIQSQIIQYMDSNPEIRWIFICPKWDESRISPELRGRLLNIISIPSLQERTIHEKELLIIHFVHLEAKKVKKQIYISDYFMELMIAKDFENSIEILRNAVVKSFVNAYEKSNESIFLDLSCIPSELKTNVCFFDKEKICLLDEYDSMYHRMTHEIFENVIDNAKEYYLSTGDYKSLYAAVEKFNDYIMFKLPKFSKMIDQYSIIVSNVANMTLSRFKITLSTNVQNLLTYSLYCQSVEYKIFNDFLEQNRQLILELLDVLKKAEELESIIVSETEIMLEKTFSIEFNALLKLILILNLKYENISMDNDFATGILICHGYSTASSIASAANTLLGEQVFYAFDMPLDVNVDEIVNKIDSYLQEKRFIEDVIVLVDMGSLEQIGNKIQHFENVNIGILNNTTTAMALEVGQGILHKTNIEQILKEASEKMICKYSYIQKKTKEKAIVFTSESGMTTAEKIKGLFVESIPNTMPIHLLSYDYYHMMQQNIQTELINNYDVLFIAGTMNPKIQGIKFINLSDIIDLSAINRIQNIFKNYMSELEIQKFTDDLIKNFSLTNVIESLTILNPKALLNIVEKSVHKLERKQANQIHPKILIGLYVHICCFVERMVKHVPIKTYPNIEEFKNTQKEFIQDVETTFNELSNHYGIELPISEIGYIYDYIHTMNVDDDKTYIDE